MVRQAVGIGRVNVFLEGKDREQFLSEAGDVGSQKLGNLAESG